MNNIKKTADFPRFSAFYKTRLFDSYKIYSLRKIKYKAPSARGLPTESGGGVHRAQRIIVCLRKQ